MFSATVEKNTIPPQYIFQSKGEPKFRLEDAVPSCIVELYKVFKGAADQTNADPVAQSNPHQAVVEVMKRSELFNGFIRAAGCQ